MVVLLCIMDGFGLREAAPDNAVAAAHKPNYDRLLLSCPHSKLDGSGPAVGLPVGQMGNSEVGHLNLGAGRVIYQDITRIDKSITDGDFFTHPLLMTSFERIAQEKKAVHLCGLLSDGCVHSSMNHLYALVELAKRQGVTELYLHAFMDGRDTPPTNGKKYLEQTLAKFKAIGLGKIASIGGRYYGMDRDKRWERVDKAYRAMVTGDAPRFADPIAAIQASYDKNVTDEFVEPVVIAENNAQPVTIHDRDVVIHFNFRADRARQLCHMLLNYDGITVKQDKAPHIELLTMTNYELSMFEAKVIFQPNRHRNILGEVVANAGLKQLRTAETEKYAHVTYFFNGGEEQQFAGEDRALIPSPKVATYDLKPEMSSVELTDNTVTQINSGKYQVVILNYANPDMVGHTGVFEAAKKAVEAVDHGLGRLLEAIDNQKGVAIVTADHGNAEVMIDPQTGGPWTAHTTNLVPCILYDPAKQLGNVTMRDGILADIAPTILDILKLAKPPEMTGNSLIVRG